MHEFDTGVIRELPAKKLYLSSLPSLPVVPHQLCVKATQDVVSALAPTRKGCG